MEAVETAASNAFEPIEPATNIAPEPEFLRGIGIGQYAPSFELPQSQASGSGMLAHDDLLGKPTVLSFWTTWCPYCRKQTPLLVDAHNRHADDVQFVGINVNEAETVVDEYVQSNSVPYRIILDGEGTVADSYSVSGYPTTYFLDAEGRVVARHVGALTSEQIDRYIDSFAVNSD